MSATDAPAQPPAPGTRVMWSGSEWTAHATTGGLVRLVRCRAGPSALARAGDTVLVSPSVLD